MFRNVAFGLAWVLLPFSVCLPISAQQRPRVALGPAAPEWLRCLNDGGALSPDVQISGCTAVLQTRSTPAQSRAIAYYRRGAAYFRSYYYDRAVADFSESIKLNPNDALVYGKRALAYHARKDYDRAIADLTKALRLNPNNAVAHIGLGRANDAKMDHDNAIAAFTEAIKIRPNNTIVPRLWRALECHRKGLRACVASDMRAVTEEMEQQTASADEYYEASYLAQNLGHYILAMELIDNATSKLGDGTLAEEPNALDKRKREIKGWSDLEGDWIQYLAEIQSENNFVNWTSPPYDLYFQSSPR